MKKIFNIILSFILALAMILSPSISMLDTNAYAEELNVLDIFREALDEKREQEGKIVESTEPSADDIVTFIIELSSKSVADLAENQPLHEAANDESLTEKVKNTQDLIIKEIKKINPNAVFNNQYTLLLNGFSVETKYSDKKKIEEIDGIKKVELANTYYKNSKTSVEMTKVSNVWKNYGYDGTGKVVAVIDSGVDFEHKDMRISDVSKTKLTEDTVKKVMNNQNEKRGQWFSDKVPFGYNYADKNCEIKDTIVDSIDYCHGMHVAGIIGANCENEDDIKLNKGVRGVAPECQILCMKIFSNDPNKKSANEADVIAAIEDAVAYKADVINMSFCMSAGFQDASEGQQKAIQRAIDEGIIVVSAAGNAAYSIYPKNSDNLKDIGTVGSPGLAHGTIQVASFENNIRVTNSFNATTKGNNDKIAYIVSDFNPTILKDEYNIVYCGLGKEADFEEKDLTGKIALIERGEIDFAIKKLNAQNKGAVAVVIYNTDESYLNYISTDTKVNIPTMVIKKSDGEKLKDLINNNVKISFDEETIEVTNFDSGEMSYYSSWGPTPNLDFKPDVTSIGGNIWSTINDNDYKSMQGTSMACPNTAGIMALISQHIDTLNEVYDENTPSEKVYLAKTMLMNTCDVKFDENDKPFSPRLQGAGLVNAFNALENKVTVTYNNDSSISLKEIEKVTQIPLKLHNYGNEDVIYNIEVLNNEEADLFFEESEVLVPAGQTVEIMGSLNCINSKNDEFVEGFIRFVPNNTNIPTLVIPYMGFYGNWADLQIIDNPKYKDNSVLNETMLVTAKSGTFGYKTYQLGGEDINPEYFAINPFDKKAHCNVLPQFSLLRNAKHISIEILNDKGEVIKVLEDKQNMRKDIVLEQQISAKVNFDWLWNGGIYDKDTGTKRLVNEGQYFIKISATADYENAKEQSLTFPLKIDKTCPIIESSVFFTDTDECILELDAHDEGLVNSSIDNFLFIVDGKKYTDEKGNSIFDLKQNEAGKYIMKLKLDTTTDNNCHIIDIGVTDHADNMTAGKAYVIYRPQSKLTIESDKENYNIGENIKINYSLKEGINESDIDKYEVCINSLKDVVGYGKNMSFTIKNLLNNGSYRIIIKAIDKDGNTIDISGKNITVGNGKPLDEKLYIENITDIEELKNGDNASIKIKALNFSKESEDVTLIVCLYDENNSLVNCVAAEKSISPNRVGYLTTLIRIPDLGNYKLKIFIWDNLDDMNSLSPYTEFDIN